MELLIVIGLLVLAVLVYCYSDIRYSKNNTAPGLKIAMSNLFLEKKIEKAVDMPLDSKDYDNVVANGFRLLSGPGYKAVVLHTRKNQIYLTAIHLSGSISAMSEFMEHIDNNAWHELEITFLEQLFLGRTKFGKVLHHKVDYRSK